MLCSAPAAATGLQALRPFRIPAFRRMLSPLRLRYRPFRQSRLFRFRLLPRLSLLRPPLYRMLTQISPSRMHPLRMFLSMKPL